MLSLATRHHAIHLATKPSSLLRVATSTRFSSSSPSSAPAPTVHPSDAGLKPPHLLTLADLTVPQIQTLIDTSLSFKQQYKTQFAIPPAGRPSSSPSPFTPQNKDLDISTTSNNSLDKKTVALLFSKRSTRTRVATETSIKLLGGQAMFLGSQDIQLGVNETLYDTTRVVSSMVDGIMARVGEHSEVETLAEHSSVPVINALSALYHPTQILADLQTILERRPGVPFSSSLSSLQGLNFAWVGDSNNVLNDMIVTFPRLGINLTIATPKGYPLDPIVLERYEQGIQSSPSQTLGTLKHTHDPLEAVNKAHVVATDTWISMGQEDETAKRLKDFEGYQITEQMLKNGKADKDCLFMHCLPRHEYEVDDEVFYGPRSVVFQEAENRKWTIAAIMHHFVGKWSI